MIENHDIICIANTTWNGRYTKSTVQLLSRMGAGNRVLFVEYPFTVKDIFTTLVGKQHAPLGRMLGFRKRIYREHTAGGNEIFILNVPPVMPFDFKPEWLYKSLSIISYSIYRTWLRKAMKELKMKDPVVITAYNPFYGLAMLRKLHEKLHVFYCYDAPDFRKHGKRVYSIEEQFSRATDSIIVTSDHLYEKKKYSNPNCTVIKNGVDFDLFNQYAKQIPSKKDHVVIGYIGSIDDRFDFKTIQYLAVSRPQWEFRFTGDIRNQAAYSQLQRLDNVVFFPVVKPEEVPLVMRDYDAGIIPYIKDESNKNVYPLKINEYLAMGIPVVMTDFASLPEFEGVVSVAGDEENFLRLLEYEILTDSTEKRAGRMKIASANSWNERARRFSEAIGEMMLKKKKKIIHA
ncbi:MAG: glycosyltransferase [Syntrophothermus sp.]